MRKAIVLLMLTVLFSSSLTLNLDLYMIDDAYAQADAAKQAQEKAKEASQKSESKDTQEEIQTQSEETSPQEKSSATQKEQKESQTAPPQSQPKETSPQEKSSATQKEQKESQTAPPQSQPRALEQISTIKEPLATEAIEERYIVVLQEGTSPQEVARSHGLTPAFVYNKALNGLAGKIPSDVIEKLKQDPRVKFVEKDHVLFKFAQTLPTGIDRIDAEKSIAKIDGMDERIQVDVAIVDSGVDLGHGDLNVNVAKSVDCTNDGTFVTCSRGGNDMLGHGTHVAGIVAAIDNDQGVVGTAPGATIWSVKVLGDDGTGWMSWLIAGIDYVTENAVEIEVVNLSLGCECQSEALDDAISRSISKGIVYVVAAGNEAKDVSTFSPANHPDVITVSAITDFDGNQGSKALSGCINDDDDTFAFFSNYGREIELAAPGACIRSTWANGGYNTQSGTSVAAPHVTGTVTLYLSENPKPQNADDVRKVRQAIIDMGFPASGSNGYSSSDDPDGIAEPLVNAGAMALSLGQQEETQPIEEEQSPTEEQVEEEKEELDVEQKLKERGLTIAEKMQQKGLAIAEKMQKRELTIAEKMQRGLAIAEKMSQRGFDIATKMDSLGGSEIGQEMSGKMGIASEMRQMGLDTAQSMALTGINIGETISERETIAEIKSEVIIEELEQKIQRLETRVQSLLERLGQGSYHLPKNVIEDSQKNSFNVSFEGQTNNGTIIGSVFLENVVTRDNVAKFKISGGEILVGESVAYDVVFGKARLIKGPAQDMLMIIGQIIDADENVSTILLAIEANELKNNMIQGSAGFNLGPQSKISNKQIMNGTGQIVKL